MKRESANMRLAFRKSDNLRFQLLLCFALDHEFLDRCGHYFFDGRTILIRDLSQQSHRAR
jgi:hypothetical protein